MPKSPLLCCRRLP